MVLASHMIRTANDQATWLQRWKNSEWDHVSSRCIQVDVGYGPAVSRLQLLPFVLFIAHMPSCACIVTVLRMLEVDINIAWTHVHIYYPRGQTYSPSLTNPSLKCSRAFYNIRPRQSDNNSRAYTHVNILSAIRNHCKLSPIPSRR